MVFEDSQCLVQILKIFTLQNGLENSCIDRSCIDKSPRWDSGLGFFSVFLFCFTCSFVSFFLAGVEGCCLLCFRVLYLASAAASVKSQLYSSASPGFQAYEPATFLHQTGVPSLGFLSALQVAALRICVYCKADGRCLVLFSHLLPKAV